VGSQAAAETVAEHVFDVVARAEALVSLHALNECFRGALFRLGFRLFAFMYVIEGEQHRNLETSFGEGFDAWANHYRRMAFADDDPIVREVESSSEPFYWTEVVRKRPLSFPALRVIDAAKQFQLHDGFVMPVRNDNGTVSFTLFAGDNVDSDDPYARAATHLLASYYGRLGNRLHQTASNRRHCGLLSQRQRECLKWARAGKSSKDIGGILGISATVVDEHIAKACERLRVRTRVQAILEAGRRGVELG
jgi:LuxR family quorum sensing-dependent transcriptional regulator